MHTFRHGYGWRIASIAPLLIAGTIFWVAQMDGPTQKEDVAIFWGIIALCAAVTVLTWIIVGKIAITMHAEGIARGSMFGSVEIPWNEIQETRYSQTPINYGAHFGLIGLVAALVAQRRSNDGASMQRNLKIMGLDGKSIVISSNFADAEDAMRMVLDRVDPPMAEKVLTQVKNGETVPFGNLALSPAGVIWKSKEPIPYSALVKCKIEGANLGVKAQGKWMNNVSVNLKNVPNVFVFLKVAERMRTGGEAKAEDYLAAAKSFSASAGF